MNFVPTLNFNGKCREAMEMYQQAFSGKITALLTCGEVNDPAYTLTEDQKNWICHGKYYDPEFGLMDGLYCRAKVRSYLELFPD